MQLKTRTNITLLLYMIEHETVITICFNSLIYWWFKFYVAKGEKKKIRLLYIYGKGLLYFFLFKNKNKAIEILNITRMLKDVGNDINGEYKTSFGGFCFKNGIIH